MKNQLFIGPAARWIRMCCACFGPFALFSLFFAACSLNAQPRPLTQDFAPVGSHWYYTNIISFFSQDMDYVEIKCIGDTVIQGKNCRHLQKTYRGRNERDEFVYSNGDTVYRLATNDSFYVLYNFAAKPGDSWLARSSLFGDGPPEEEMTITVDSTSMVTINGQNLKTLYVSSDHSCLSFGDYWGPLGRARIIERLGGSWYMFPFNYGWLDAGIRIGLRCYSDDSLGFYSSGIATTCDEIITNVHNEEDVMTSNAYPNPFTNQLTFEVSDNDVATLFLYDFTGNRVFNSRFTSSITIATNAFHDGIYFYELTTIKGFKKTGKLVRR